MSKPLFIPIILGTARKGRRSENAARFVFEETKKRAGVETEFVDICKIPIRLDDAGERLGNGDGLGHDTPITGIRVC